MAAGIPFSFPPMPDAPAATRLPPWTSRDEAKRSACVRELESLNERRVVARNALAAALTNAGVPGNLADMLISHAEPLRDALAPFDSGERPARSESDA